MASGLSTGLAGSRGSGSGGSYQQSGPSSPQQARAVLNELGGQTKGFGAVPASLVLPNLLIQAVAPGVGGESISVAIVARSTTPLAAPASVTAVPVGSGGTLADGDYHYKVTALNAEGETTGSTDVAATAAAGGTDSVTVSWAARTGATGYKIYRSATANAQNVSPALVATVGAVTSYLDTGTATVAGAVPATNTADTGEAQNVSVGVSGNAITVTVPVDEAGNADASAADVRDAINTNTAAHALVSAAVLPSSDPASTVAPIGTTFLTGDLAQGQGVASSVVPLPKQHAQSNRYT